MTLSDHQLAQISHSLTEQLNTAIEDIIGSALETFLDVSDYDMQSDISYEAISGQQGDIEELAELLTGRIDESFTNEVARKSAELLEQYAECVLPFIKESFEQDGQVDGPARRESWCNFIDAENRDGNIGDQVAALVDADVEAL